MAKLLDIKLLEVKELETNAKEHSLLKTNAYLELVVRSLTKLLTHYNFIRPGNSLMASNARTTEVLFHGLKLRLRLRKKDQACLQPTSCRETCMVLQNMQEHLLTNGYLPEMDLLMTRELISKLVTRVKLLLLSRFHLDLKIPTLTHGRLSVN